jgi:heterodisulfide reductase subunit B
MPYKDESVRKSKNREYSRKDYEGNYAKRRQSLAARKKELKQEWDTFKATLACTKCGFSHSAALDFHHEDPSTKEHSVNQLISDGRFRKAYEEIKKCIVLCANCHRIHHYKEKKNPAL